MQPNCVIQKAQIIIDGIDYEVHRNHGRIFKSLTRNDSVALIDMNNQFIIPLSDYDYITPLSFGIRVKSDKNYGLFDYQGEEILPTEYRRMNEYLPKIGIYTNYREIGFYNLDLGKKTDSLFCEITGGEREEF